MKTRFSTYDIMCMVTELQRLVGMRVNQVYDIDNRTYVIRLQQSEEKAILLLESGNRFHTTLFEWPKNMAPSGFTMKLRKHLKNKRLEKLSQIGIDRVVDLQFGSGEAAYHIILELYDRGNIVLTDCDLTILNVLRPHVEGDKIRFAVKEKYPLDRAKTSYEAPNGETLREILAKSKPGDNLKKILNPNLEYGSAIIDHVLQDAGLAGNMKLAKEPGKGFYIEQDLEKLVTALKQAEKLLDDAKTQVAKGYIIQKAEERPNPEGGAPTFLVTNQEFHPMLYHQAKSLPHEVHETFDRAVDEFFSALEGQKIDLKTVQIEREAMKKLHNVRKDHEKRVSSLKDVQVQDRRAAELIARNEPLVEQCRLAVQAALANQMSWDDINLLVKTAQENNDPIASNIKQLKLDKNHISLYLTDPYTNEGEGLDPMMVDVDLSLTAFANARRYYDQKRGAAKKQQKTLESADKALKSAERKTKQTLKEANTVSNIIKARRTYWFEKFYWFISSDNYLIIAGRDQQQNELLVKRYMRACDLYVHAEVTGASSVVIKNPSGAGVPPRTLAEAGQAAVAYSVAWEAKVVTRAWWVMASQVSKSAPTGEYLGTGSFMIRGKKNYVLTDQLSFGFSFMFRLEDSCIERHRDERKPAVVDDASDVTSVQEQDHEEIVVSEGDDGSRDEVNPSNLQEYVTSLNCRTIRIGSYQYTPKEKVFISSIGIKIVAPSLKNESRDVALQINLKEVVRILVHCGKGVSLKPVIFLYTMSQTGQYIRNYLDMVEDSGPFYDPKSKVDPYKRITLLPEAITDEDKSELKALFGKVMDELSSREANEILVRTCPEDVKNILKIMMHPVFRRVLEPRDDSEADEPSTAKLDTISEESPKHTQEHEKIKETTPIKIEITPQDIPKTIAQNDAETANTLTRKEAASNQLIGQHYTDMNSLDMKMTQLKTDRIDKDIDELERSFKKDNDQLERSVKKDNDQLERSIKKDNDQLERLVKKDNDQLERLVKKDNDQLERSVKKDNDQLERSVKKDNDQLERSVKKDNDQLERLVKKDNDHLTRSFKKEIESETADSSDDEYPDTHVKVDHGTGEVILKSKARTISEASDRSDDKPPSFPSLPKKGGKKPQKKQEEKQEVKKEVSKRGKMGKIKKMKEKYKDQDEEDRIMAMEILQSAKEEKEAKKAQKKSAVKGGKSKQKQGPKIPQPPPLLLELSDAEDEDNPEPEVEQPGPDADAELLSQLTGAPLPDDELLFAVPVVAPYSALHHYKYKVKLTPGTGKRGKAAKTAVQVFLRDKAASAREKDLLKAVKEENVARNFPGKVKLSAPQLHKHKK